GPAPQETELRMEAETAVGRPGACKRETWDHYAGNSAGAIHTDLWPTAEKERPYRRPPGCAGGHRYPSEHWRRPAPALSSWGFPNIPVRPEWDPISVVHPANGALASQAECRGQVGRRLMRILTDSCWPQQR